MLNWNASCLCKFKSNHKKKSPYWLPTKPSLTPGTKSAHASPLRHLKTVSTKQCWTYGSPSVLHFYFHIVKWFPLVWTQWLRTDFIVPYCWVGISAPFSCQEHTNSSWKWKVLQTLRTVSRPINCAIKEETQTCGKSNILHAYILENYCVCHTFHKSKMFYSCTILLLVYCSTLMQYN